MNIAEDEAVTPAPPLGYLLSRYPAVSHTFLLHEVRGLRELGLRIETASVNPPDRTREQLSPVEAEEAGRTLYLKSLPRARVLTGLLGAVLRSPGSVLRGLRAAARLRPSSISQRLYSLFYLVEALLLCEWIRAHRIRHLHVHFGGAVATVGMLAAAAARIPYSLTIHGPDEFFDETRFHLRQKLESAAFVICISQYCRSQLMRIAPAACWNRFETVRLGIRPELLPQHAPRDPRLPLEIVVVGRLVSAKGPLLLLQALQQVRAQGIPMSLTLVGTGPERETVEAFLDRHAMRDGVTLTGALNHDQTLERVARADLFVLASFAEGIPVALMEAMAIGVPCISTYIAGIPELIHHEHNGLLVPAGSVDDLTAAIVRLARDPDLRHRLAEAARSHVLREYHLPENLKQLAAALQRRFAAHDDHD